ncbi:esterase/lipase [Mycena crocata]|nr:esterase/lipase [Mycena crocata]
MLILHDPACLLHNTVELLGANIIPALESPARLESILTALRSHSAASRHEVRIVNYGVSAASNSHLSKLLGASHDAAYLDHLSSAYSIWLNEGLIEDDGSVLPECFQVSGATSERATRPPKDVYARAGFYAFDMSSGIAKNTWPAILASANLAVSAVQLLSSGAEEGNDTKTVLALCRPPGHHCNARKAGGYCYVNNAVLAAEALQRRHEGEDALKPKVAVLDLDFHHGNGTQEYFYADPSVLIRTTTGFEDELGTGEGVGFNVNLPLDVDASVDAYLGMVDVAAKRVREFGAGALVVSLGFDTFRLDPLGKFDIDTEDYAKIAQRMRGAEGVRDLPAVVLLEGGYVVERLGENLVSFMKGWEDGES